MLRFMEEKLRPSQVGARLKLVADSSCIELVLQKGKDHFPFVLLYLIQDSNIISFLPKVILNVFQTLQNIERQ